MGFLLPLLVAGLVMQQPETMSLLKEPLFPPPLPRAERARLERELATARADAARDPGNVDAVLHVARVQRDLGNIGDALETLTRGAEGKADTPAVHLERGRGFIVIRKFEVAQRELKKAVETIPEAHCDIALTAYLLADYKQAKEEYGQCPKPGMFAALAARRADESSTAALPSPESADKHDLTGPYVNAVGRLLAHDTSGARDLLKPLVEKHKDRWMEPIYIAAEADYARIAPSVKHKKRKK